MRIKYRRATISVDVDKPKTCEGCKRTIGKEIKKLDCHHWKYEFTTDEVRKNPKLVLKNTSWLCFTCHRLGDALRKVLADTNKSQRLLDLADKATEGVL